MGACFAGTTTRSRYDFDSDYPIEMQSLRSLLRRLIRSIKPRVVIRFACRPLILPTGDYRIATRGQSIAPSFATDSSLPSPSKERMLSSLTAQLSVRCCHLGLALTPAQSVKASVFSGINSEDRLQTTFNEHIGLIWSDRVNWARSVGLFWWFAFSFPEDRPSSSRSSFERRFKRSFL
jgi:hypothetical protein